MSLRLAVLVGMVAAAAAAAADSSPETAPVELHYRAYVAGIKVGEARVGVTLAGERYLVRGDARSDGVLQGFSDWRNVFTAGGRLVDGRQQPATFAYTETDRRKSRRLVISDGTLQVTKNGKARRPRPSPAGPDVVSALFVQPRCSASQTLHTGRHVYHLRRLEPAEETCRYQVEDDDGDGFELELTLATRQGLSVPAVIRFRSWLDGRIELVEETPAR